MISLWYPAEPIQYQRAPYMTARAAAHFDQGLARFVPRYRVGVMDWAGTPTHAGIDAPVAPARGGHPVVLYGPGGGNARTVGTVLVEELASRGYVAVTVDHTYESGEVEFPDGRVAVDQRPADATRGESTTVRVADLRFVVDSLAEIAAGRSPDVTERPLPTGLRDGLDLSRLGMVGYSAGGYAAAEAMLADRRIRAGVNLDGQLLADDDPVVVAPVAQPGLDRPFLQFAVAGHTRESDPSWAAFWMNPRAWRRELRLAGATHFGLSDLQVALPAIGQVMGLTTEEVSLALGSIDPVRSVAAQRAYVTAFVDRHLRGRRGGLLDHASPRFPEVTFVP
ncbi:MAG TPA: hypothetical protein VFY84_17680 [Jiangellales bacterium]|nr:hypothetical protein [Jiangellales bacterium]